MFRYYSGLMLAAAVVGAVLSNIASGALFLTLGLVMLGVGTATIMRNKLFGAVALSMGGNPHPDTLHRLRPIRVNQKFEAFVVSRRQGAFPREAYCLVRDGVASADDVDRVDRVGLGLRWSYMHRLKRWIWNTRGGTESQAQIWAGPSLAWTLVRRVAAERRSLISLADWEARVAWRDEQLINLIYFKEEVIP